MAGVNELLANGGNLPALAAPQMRGPDTPRKRGLKKGLFIFLLSFLIVPLVTIFTIAIGAKPFAVVISAILLTVGGLLRAAYAFMFESNVPHATALEQGAQNLFNKSRNAQALPPQQSIPVDAYAPPVPGNWRDTNDLTPSSVTESTTKLLQKDQ